MIPFDDDNENWDGTKESLRKLLARHEDIDRKLDFLKLVRKHSNKTSEKLDRLLLEDAREREERLCRVKAALNELSKLHESLTAPPWYPARFLGWTSLAGDNGNGAAMALVMQQGMHKAVSAGKLDAAALERGDDVFLAQETNVIVGKADTTIPRGGEMVFFDRWTSETRMVVRSRDEEFFVTASERLTGASLRPGDALLWDRDAAIVLEIVPRPLDTSRFLEDTPSVRFDDIGGLDEPIAALERSFELHWLHRDVVARYRLKRRGSVLLVGPPGTGKTMMAKALANWLAERSPSKRARFMNIKPQSLHSSWYGESERNYRRVFEIGREASEREPDVPVVMFFDEVDAVGGRRGTAHTPIDDRVQTAFMTELDGLESRGGILVVSATNRRDAIDPALVRPGRLGDLVLEIPRPRRQAGRRIFEKHFDETIPYASSRDDVLACAVSRLYAPNADTELARVTLRDATSRTIRAADLVSGAVIANIAQKAIELACSREVAGGAPGLAAEDVVRATNDELDSLTRALTPANCRHHVHDLPQDVDVVRVEPIERTPSHAFEYVSLT